MLDVLDKVTLMSARVKMYTGKASTGTFAKDFAEEWGKLGSRGDCFVEGNPWR